jgi:hypothetical protein
MIFGHEYIVFCSLQDIKENRLVILNQVALNAFAMRQGVPVFFGDRMLHAILSTFVKTRLSVVEHFNVLFYADDRMVYTVLTGTLLMRT